MPLSVRLQIGDRGRTSHSMLNALSFTRAGLMWSCADVRTWGVGGGVGLFYARCFRQTAQGPFANLGRSVYGSRVCLRNPRFTDDVHYELLGCLATHEWPFNSRSLEDRNHLDVTGGIFQTAIGVMVACEINSWGIVCDLLDLGINNKA